MIKKTTLSRVPVFCMMLLALTSLSKPASASEILHIIVASDSHFYQRDQEELSGYLSDIPGMNVTVGYLYPCGLTVTANSSCAEPFMQALDDFNQIWVTDQSALSDDSPAQRGIYYEVAHWFNNQESQNIILDGRILASSSFWTSRPVIRGSASTTMSSEAGWIQNYALQLDLVGGGLVLGTDHATAFTRGINEINRGIGIGQFTGYYHETPFQSVVVDDIFIDTDSLDSCATLVGEHCINDNASSSMAPTDLQPNGMILYPLAQHVRSSNSITTSVSYSFNPLDSDGDGVPDFADPFPHDPTEWADSDNDGVGDNSDAFPNDASEQADSDGDGVGDNADAFPFDASEQADSDGDGVGDNADAFPYDASEQVDSDGDGVGDNADAFPNAPTEWLDSDGDGIGDNADPNDNSDASATVVINGIDSGVENVMLGNGETLADLVTAISKACLESARNHGQYVSCTSQAFNGLVKDSLIAGSDRGKLVSAVAKYRD